MSDLGDFSVVLLAAGLSQRMGEINKLLVPVEGVALVRRSAQIYCDLGMHVTAVLGHESAAVRQALGGLALDTVVNPAFEKGQQSSVRTGVEAVQLEGAGLLVALADQPLLTRDDVARFCAAFLAGPQDKALVPYFGQERGNPVLFPTALATRIRDDGSLPGCRRFLDANPSLVARYAAPNDHFTRDLDSPEDAERLHITISRG